MSSINFYVRLSDAEDDITIILKILNPIKSSWWDNPSVKTTVLKRPLNKHSMSADFMSVENTILLIFC